VLPWNELWCGQFKLRVAADKFGNLLTQLLRRLISHWISPS